MPFRPSFHYSFHSCCRCPPPCVEMEDMEERLYEAADAGNLSEVKRLIEDNPSLSVNWRNERDCGRTPLHRACARGYAAIVSVLLAHPHIDVNQKDEGGDTPFLNVCLHGRTSCSRLLLKDPRVSLGEPENDGYTPLYWAAFGGYLEVIRWWIASGREIDLGEQGNWRTDAVLAAEEMDFTDVVTLLQGFKDNPAETRHVVRVELGMHDELAAEMFALVVFVSDGLLDVDEEDGGSPPAARFFAIAARLPLELQMVLCYRLVDSARVILHRKDGELAFRDLARTLEQEAHPLPSGFSEIRKILEKMGSLF